MTRTSKTSWVVLGLLAVSGCAGWQRVDLPPDTTLARRQQVQIWRGTTATVVHAVRVTPDTVSGIPYFKRPSCDSCAIAIPRNQVDSLRLGDGESPAMAVIIVSIGSFLLLAITLAAGLNGS